MWMELVKDYDCITFYHLSKVNVVVDALSLKSIKILAHVSIERKSLVWEMRVVGNLGVHFKVLETDILLAHFKVRSVLIGRIREAQDNDQWAIQILEDPEGRKGHMFTWSFDGVLRYDTNIYVLDKNGLRIEILEKAYMVAYVPYSCATKI